MENAKNIIIVTDREESIVQAIMEVFPNWNHFFCWNHLLNDVKMWLQKRVCTSDDKTVYVNNIARLLNCATFKQFEQELDCQQQKRSKTFKDYYFKHIHDSITKKAGRWILSSFECYFPNSGITTNSSESFNATLKRVFNHQEVKIHQTVLSLYFLQNYYLKEIMRGYCNLGEWNLKLFHLRKLISNVDFPKDAISPDEVARVVRNEISEGSQVDHKDPLRSWVTGIAKYLVLNNRVSLNSTMGCFNVCGLKDALFVVQLFPKETCSCTFASNCCHITACKLAVGQTIVNKKYYNLSEIRQKARGRVKSGANSQEKKMNFGSIQPLILQQ